MPNALFCSLDFQTIADDISRAQRSICYAAPGIHQKPAEAIAAVAGRLGPEVVAVCIDFDERVMRMGFGDLSSISMLRDAGIVVRSTAGLRTGLLIVDDEGYIFTPVALYLESDRRDTDAPNALRLSRDQVVEAQARLSPTAKAIVMARAKTPEERERIREQAVELKSTEVSISHFAEVSRRLEAAPPVQFDVARQVHVFEAYLQYVELKLTGVAIQRHRIAIPRKIQNLGTDGGVQARLNTTFNLIEKESELSSKPINDELTAIRNDLTRSLGKEHGRVLLKAQKPLLQQRLAALRGKLEKFQVIVKEKLQAQLEVSKKEIAEYYVPHVLENPPDSFSGQLLTAKPTSDDARKWLSRELDAVFPQPEQLIRKMVLDEIYKDVTFETLNRKDFLSLLQDAFPDVDWEKPYKEFRAAGEQIPSSMPNKTAL